MGPYCNFCQRRCFTYLDLEGLPQEMVTAYRAHRIDIIATCVEGQASEKERIGYCYNDIVAAQKGEHSTCHSPYLMPLSA